MHILITARMGSSRLPGKVLKPLGDTTILQQVIRRAKQIKNVEDIIVATPLSDTELPICKVCREEQVKCYGGDEDDIYQRHLGAFEFFDIEAALHWSCDSPFHSIELLNRASDIYHANKGHDFYALSKRWYTGSGGRKFSIISRSFLDKLPPIMDLCPVWRKKYWAYAWYCHMDFNARITFFYEATVRKFLFDVFIMETDDLWWSLGYEKVRMKLSIDYPLELAMCQKICDYLGYFPNNGRDFVKALEGVHSL